jgi:hypothetical protein
MQPRQMARPASFGPDELRVIFAAYDAAWREIALKVGTDSATTETARLALATIVLGLAGNKPATPKTLAAMAVAVFCANRRIDAESAA